MEKKSAAPARVPSYIELETSCQWQREERRDVLVLHLPAEFKREELTVQINNRGILKISGQHSIDAWKKSKFYKEVEVPKNCDTNGIRAKFANGCLYVIMPKTPTSTAPTKQTKAPEFDGSWVDHKKSKATQAPLIEKPAPAEDKETAGSIKEEMQPTADEKKFPEHDVIEPKPSGPRNSCVKTSFNVAVAVAGLAGLGAYVSYMYKWIYNP